MNGADRWVLAWLRVERDAGRASVLTCGAQLAEAGARERATHWGERGRAVRAERERAERRGRCAGARAERGVVRSGPSGRR